MVIESNQVELISRLFFFMNYVSGISSRKDPVFRPLPSRSI